MVTLEITDTRINLLVLQGRHVRAAASWPLEPGLVKEGIIADRAAVGQRLKELMDAYGVTESQVIVGISGLHAIYRVFNLPRLPRGMLDEAVKRQVGKVLPVPESEVYISWQAIEISGTETLICLVGIPRNSVDAVTEALRLVGLESRIMDVSPLALARVVDESNAIIINAQPDSFDILVMLDGIPRLLRSLTMAQPVVPISDVEATLREELDRTVAFLDLSREGYPKTGGLPVFVGGESRQMVADALPEYPVKPLPQWFSLPEGLDVGDYAVNIGLALKQVKAGRAQSRVNMNVVPEIYQPKPFPIMVLVFWAIVLIAVASLIPVSISTVGAVSQTTSLQAQLNSLERQVETATGTLVPLAKLKTKVDQSNAKLAILKQPMANFKAQRVSVNEKLAKVTSLKPGNVELITINGGTTFTVSGTAPDRALVLNYASAIRDSGKFSRVVVQQLTEVKFNEWSFTLSLN